MKPKQSSPAMRRFKGLMLKNLYGMITCREFDDFIDAYLEGKLSGPERRRFTLHLRLCRECREYLEAYKQTVQVGRAVFTAPEEPVPGDVPERLVEAVLKARQEDPATK